MIVICVCASAASWWASGHSLAADLRSIDMYKNVFIQIHTTDLSVLCPFLYSAMRLCMRVYAGIRLCMRVYGILASWVPFVWIFSLIHFYSSGLRVHVGVYLWVPCVWILLLHLFPFARTLAYGTCGCLFHSLSFLLYLCGYACLRDRVCSCVRARTRCASRAVFGTSSVRWVYIYI